MLSRFISTLVVVNFTELMPSIVKRYLYGTENNLPNGANQRNHYQLLA